MNDLLVQECDAEETAEIYRRLGLQGPTPGLMGKLEGWVDAVCREEDGSVAWEVHQKNLITNLGYFRYAMGWHQANQAGQWRTGATSMYIFLSPSTEAPVASRYTLVDDGTGIGLYANQAGPPAADNPSYNAATLTWTYSYTFGTGNRQIGTIGLGSAYQTTSGIWGPVEAIFAYTLLTPAKTQTGSQTVETVYRVTFIPLY